MRGNNLRQGNLFWCVTHYLKVFLVLIAGPAVHVSDSGERLFQVIIYCCLWATKPKCRYWTWNERPTIFLQNAPLILQFGWWSAHTIPAFTLLGFRLIKQALNFPSSFIQTLTSPQTWISNLKKNLSFQVWPWKRKLLTHLKIINATLEEGQMYVTVIGDKKKRYSESINK